MTKRTIAYATAATLLLATPAYAQVPVEDAAANASLAEQVAQGLEELGHWAKQIENTAKILDLETAASRIEGGGIGAELGVVFRSAKEAYSRINSAYGGIMAVPANFERDLQLFMPPPGGWESMTLPQLMNRAEAIRRLTEDTALTAAAKNIIRQEERNASRNTQEEVDRFRKSRFGRDQQLLSIGELSSLNASTLHRIEQAQADEHAAIQAERDEKNTKKKIERAILSKEASDLLAGATARMNEVPQTDYTKFDN